MKWIVFLIFLPSLAAAQGFAGLGTDAAGFANPKQGTPLAFPKDHGAHPDYRIEWWYVTANLTDESGTPYGVQWTLFRSALAPEKTKGWQSPQLWMGHAALTTRSEHFVAERLARGGIGQAGTKVADQFEAWIDDWYLRGSPDYSALQISAVGPQFSYDLSLKAQAPIVLHGAEGYSVKSDAGQASYYYSQPFFEVHGVLSLPKGDVPVTGHAWLDREWSSQPLASDQTGWDWFSLNFQSGARMMGFVLRSNTNAPYTSATWITPEGHATAMPNGSFKARALEWSHVAQREIPTAWQLLLPEKGVNVNVNALNPKAWMDTSFPYWEGPIEISGSHQGAGYLEMTGY